MLSSAAPPAGPVGRRHRVLAGPLSPTVTGLRRLLRQLPGAGRRRRSLRARRDLRLLRRQVAGEIEREVEQLLGRQDLEVGQRVAGPARVPRAVEHGGLGVRLDRALDAERELHADRGVALDAARRRVADLELAGRLEQRLAGDRDLDAAAAAQQRRADREQAEADLRRRDQRARGAGRAARSRRRSCRTPRSRTTARRA